MWMCVQRMEGCGVKAEASTEDGGVNGGVYGGGGWGWRIVGRKGKWRRHNG